jgi:hypothetical protein
LGRRSRRREKQGRSGPSPPTASSDYTDADGNVLTLRDHLSDGTQRQLDALEARPAASSEDRWQRRVEFLFERLAIRWELAGLPLEGQKELLGRYRMASSEERRWVRQTLDEHVRAHLPDLAC